jgi:hypothetical protein
LAEETEITNVGGDGVASEATLLNLLSAMESLGGKGGGKSAAAKAQEMYNKRQADGIKIIDTESKVRDKGVAALKKANAALKKFGSVLADATAGGLFAVGASLKNLSTEILMGGNQIGDFTKHLPLVGDHLGILTGYFQGSIDTFRNLSDVGAGFGGDILAMRQASADASLSLEQFASLVGGSSGTLTMLGSTVTQGAQRLGSMTKELRNADRGLMNLGFTQESLNEGMVDYLENQALAGQLRGRSDRSLIDGAQNYLTELDKLSKITGKSRKELAEQMNQNGQAANINVTRARLSGEALMNFDNNLAHLTTMVPGLGDAFKDLSDGIPQTEVGQVLTSLVPGFKELAEANASGRISQEEFQRRLADLTPQITRAFDSMDPAQVQALMGREGFDGLLGSLSEVRTYTQRQTKAAAAAAEQANADAKRQPLTAFLANFEQTVQDVRSKFESAFIESGVLDFIGEELAGGAGTLMEQIDGLADTLQTYLGSDDFKNDFQSFKDALANTKTAITEFIDNFRKFDLKTALFGGKKGDVIGKNEDGTDKVLATDVSGLFKGMEGESIKSIIFSNLTSAIGGLFLDFDITWDDIIVGGLAGIGALIAAPVIGIPGAITAAIIAVVGKDKLIELFNGTWEVIKGFFSFGTDVDSKSYSIGNLANGAWETVKGWFTFGEGESAYSLSTLVSDAWTKITGFFDFGEEGFSFSALFDKAWDVVTGYFSWQGQVWTGIGGLFDEAWTKVTGWLSFGDKTWSLSKLMSDAWETVKGFFSFGEEFSISKLTSDAWDSVTGFFSFGGEEFSISKLTSDAWESVTGFFRFGEEGFSISELFNEAWGKITGIFKWGEDVTGFSISGLLSTAWETVTGMFGFGSGEDAVSFSISGLLSTAWETITGFFSFEGIEIPSISSLFQGIIDTVKGFFSFDFEMPSFKQYLPKWLGGEGKSLLGGSDTEVEVPEVPTATIDAAPAVESVDSLVDAQSAMVSFANIDGLQNNLDIIKNGLDTDGVRSYTASMERLVEVLGKLNDELSKDNKYGPGTGENAGSVLSKMGSIGGSAGSEEVNSTLQLVLNELKLHTAKQGLIEVNTRSRGIDISRTVS